MSDYQPRAQGGWPTQPPANGQAGYGQDGRGQGGYSQGSTGRDDYGQGQGGYSQGSTGQGGYGQGSTGRDDYGRGGQGQDSYGQGGYGPTLNAQQAQPGRPPRRRRRHRGLITLGIVLVVILVILGVGDQFARTYAQNRVAQQIQTSADMSAKPSVTIEGWPFLTQVASHNLKAVDIKADNVTTSGGKLPVSFSAKATGVHLNSSFDGATVNHIAGQASITYQALDSYLGTAIGIPGLTGINFTADPSAGPNVVKADFGIGSVDATVMKTGASQLTIKFGDLGGIASLLGSAGSIPPQVIDIPKLPGGVVIGSPTVNSQGIVIPASASNTTLTQ